MTALRVAFFGTPAFAVPTLKRLLDSAHQVAGVVTQPDRPRGRGQRVSDGPVKAIAAAAGIPVLQPERLAREAFEAAFAALGADLGVVAAYGNILPDWLLATPRLGMVNVHASLLPRFRGASPVHRAVMSGDRTTGVTIMRVVKALDAGPILAQAEVPFGPDDTAATVEHLLAVRGATLLIDTLDRLAEGPVPETPQDESRVTYASKLTKTEGLVNWSRAAVEVHNHIRALTPWPRAYTFLDGARYILHRSRVSAPSATKSPPGTIATESSPQKVIVVCGDQTALELLDIQLAGKRVVSAGTALAHGTLQPGSRFSNA